MDAEAALKKVFAKLDEFGKRFEQFDERLKEIDPNGKLDELKSEMERVSANSSIVVSTMHAHGSSIHRLERSIDNLVLNCPVAAMEAEKPIEEMPGNGEERLRPSSSEYEALQAAVEEDED